MPEDDGEATEPLDGNNAGRLAAEDLSEFVTLTGHFYRGEMDRATTWRSRMDQTTNWAVIVVAAILTWAFSGGNRPHYVVLIGVFGVSAFLVMEANRYREYDVWRDRVRTIQRNVLAETFDPGTAKEDDWQDRLAANLRDPSFDIPFRVALNHRLRRSYLALMSILVIAWVARITAFVPEESWHQTAAILVIPGEVVVGVVAVFYAGLVSLTLWSAWGTRSEEFD